jgi:HD-like signal output (HDOD) protein
MAEKEWDYAAWAEAHSQGPQLQERRVRLQRDYDAVETRMRCTNVTEWKLARWRLPRPQRRGGLEPGDQ